MNLAAFYVLGSVSVLAVSLFVFFIFSRCALKICSQFLYVMIFASAYMIIAQYLKYRGLHFYVDFAHWAELLRNIAVTGKPSCLSAEFASPGIMNYFSAHFVPLIYILALPFKVWPRSETIIFLNFFLMLSSIVPLCKLSLCFCEDRRFGLFTAVLLLWYPTFQYIVLYEFEMLRFSIPVILWMLYFWKKRRIVPYFIFVFLAVFVREEVGLTIMMFGLYLALIEKRIRFGLVTAAIGLAAFFIITRIIMPSLSSLENYRHVAAQSFSNFGSSPFEIAARAIRCPMLTLAAIFQSYKSANIFMLFLPLLFVPFLAPGVLISVLANLGVGMISASPAHISYMLYYVSPSVPFIFYAFMKGWPRLIILLENTAKKWALNLKGDLNQAAMSMALAGVLAANVFFGPSPISLQFWLKDLRPAPFRTQDFHYSAYKVTERDGEVEEFCGLIPDSAVVSAQRFLFSRLFKKKGIMIFPKLESKDIGIKADYILFDRTNNGVRKESPAYIIQAEFDLIEKDRKTWKLVKSGGGYFLYERIKK